MMYIWIRNSSRVATDLVIFVFVGVALFEKKPKAPSFQFGSGRIWLDCTSSKYALFEGVGF